jgi:hypothetical protein
VYAIVGVEVVLDLATEFVHHAAYRGPIAGEVGCTHLIAS